MTTGINIGMGGGGGGGVFGNALANSMAQNAVSNQGYTSIQQIQDRDLRDSYGLPYMDRVKFTVNRASNGYILTWAGDRNESPRVKVAHTLDELRDLITAALVECALEDKHA